MYRVSYYEKTKRGIFPAYRDYSFLFLAKWFCRSHPGAKITQI